MLRKTRDFTIDLDRADRHHAKIEINLGNVCSTDKHRHVGDGGIYPGKTGIQREINLEMSGLPRFNQAFVPFRMNEANKKSEEQN